MLSSRSCEMASLMIQLMILDCSLSSYDQNMTHSLLLQSIFSFCYIFLYIYILKGQCHEIFDLYFLCFKHVICAKIISRTLYFLLRNQLQSSKYGGPLCDAIFRIVKILSGICKHSQVLFCLTVSLQSVRGLRNLMWMFVQSLFCLRSEGLHINTVSTQSTATSWTTVRVCGETSIQITCFFSKVKQQSTTGTLFHNIFTKSKNFSNCFCQIKWGSGRVA